MRCEDALVRMLDVDVAALSGTGTDALAMHIHSCAKCGAVAGALRNETGRLANAFSEPHGIAAAVRHRNKFQDPRQFVSPVLALAASFLLWLMVRPPTDASLQRIEADVPLPANATAPIVRAPAAVKPPPRITPALVRLPLPLPTLPVAVEAVAVVTAPRDVGISAPDVQIDPEPGARATVFRGSNPNVTVVWLNK